MNASLTTGDELGMLVTYNPIAVRVDETLEQLADRIRTSGFHHWPVVDDSRRLIGIVSEADIVRHYAARCAAADVLAGQGGAALNPVLAEEIMSPRVFCIEMHATRAEVLDRMVRHEIHSLPVVDNGHLVGIVTSTDILREFSTGELCDNREPVSRRMTKTEDWVDAAATLDEARMELVASGLSYLPVTKGECPLGVISQRMLRTAKCHQMLQDALDEQATPGSDRILSLVQSAPTIKPGERLTKAAALMVDYSVQAIAVVSQGSKLFGVISEDEILRAALEAMV